MKMRKIAGCLLLCLLFLLTGCTSGNSQITKIDDKYQNNMDIATATANVEQQTEETVSPTMEEQPFSGTSATQVPNATQTATPSQSTESTTSSKTKVSKKPNETASPHKTAKSVKKKKTTQKSSKKNSSTKNDSNTTSKSQKEAAQSVSSQEDSSQKATPTPTASPKAEEKTCTIAIDCKTILANKKDLNTAKADFVPSDGIILKKTTVTIKSKDTVYDILYRICKSKSIHLEADYTPAYKTYYVKGINQLYEMDCGDLSGWTYKVNGITPNYGASKYTVKEGDNIEWRFTCNAGKDVE